MVALSSGLSFVHISQRSGHSEGTEGGPALGAPSADTRRTWAWSRSLRPPARGCRVRLLGVVALSRGPSRRESSFPLRPGSSARFRVERFLDSLADAAL